MGVGVNDCAAGGVFGEGGIGVSVDQVGVGLWLLVYWSAVVAVILAGGVGASDVVDTDGEGDGS